MADRRPAPALLLDELTPVYDVFVRLMLRERAVKRDLIAHALLAPGHRVLDLGAGTGTLAIMIKRFQPAAQVTGLDADPKILAIAREKAARAGVQLAFEVGNVTELPYADRSFDRILSTLVFSLLSRAEKQRAVREAYRVLTGGGEFHLADFGPPHTGWGRLLAARMRRFEPISGNLDGCLPAMFQAAGFENVAESARVATLLGTISILRGHKPD